MSHIHFESIRQVEDHFEAEEESFPRLHVPFERLLSETAAGGTALPPVPEGPDTAALTVRRFDPVAGDPTMKR